MLDSRSLVLIALFAALIVVLGLIPPLTVAIIPVPIHAQSLGVLVAGIVLGARRGALTVLLFIALAAIGLPVLSGGRGGLAVFLSPTAGYLVGYVPAALITGWLAHRVRALYFPIKDGRPFAGFMVAAVFGVIAIHLCGIAWLATYVGLSPEEALIGDLIFVPGDLAKAVVAAYVGTIVVDNFSELRRIAT